MGNRKQPPQSLSELLISVLVFTIVLALLVVVMAPAVAADGHGESGKLEHRVNTEGKSGLNLLLANLYNDQRLLYSLVVTLTMAVLGIVVAQVTELVLRLFGARKSARAH